MNVRDAALKSGLPSKTVRYYDEIGLVVPDRRRNGYRDYDDQAVQKLAFLKRARQLGFSIDDCRRLLSLYEDKDRASADVKELAKQHLLEIDKRLDELKHLRKTLSDLVHSCRGDHRPDCPILADLAHQHGRK
jgi:MerR family copper efflux transcriptional regulator